MEILSGLRALSSFTRSDAAVIFGGSFNPPHTGHQIVVAYALELFDGDFFVLPTKAPPHKTVEIPFEKRFEWAVRAFEPFGTPRLFVYDLERHIEGVNYAIKNVEHFAKHYDKIFLLVGEDALGNIERWYDYRRLLGMTTFLVYPRTRDGSLFARGRQVLGELYNSVVELKMPLVEISSSEIRERIARGASVVGLVPEAIRRDVENAYRRAY